MEVLRLSLIHISSVEKVIHPEVITEQWISYVILAISIALKFWMYLFNKGIGWRIHSETMKATAADSLNDCISTEMCIRDSDRTDLWICRRWWWNDDVTDLNKRIRI